MIEYIPDGRLLSSFIVAVLIVVGGASVFYYCCKHSSCFIPGMRARSFILYFVFLRGLTKKVQIAHPLCLTLQILCGLCKVFDKEKILRFWVLNRPFILFFKPETVKVILSSTVATEKSHEYQFLHPWLGTGLLTSKGEKWRIRRKLLTPTFHFRVLEEFLPIFEEQSQVLVSKLKTTSNKPWVDIVPLLTMCTLDIICQTAMGVKINAQNGGCTEYVTAIYEIGEILFHRILRPWFWFDSIFYNFPSGRKFKANLQLVHNFTRKVIKEKKKEILKNNRSEKTGSESPSTVRKRRAFLELLLEHHLADNSLTEEDIREEVDTFMFEGHDTTAMAICWTLYNLGLHPEIQEEVYNELESIFEDDNLRPITREDLSRMKYLECVIKETLRLYPSVPLFTRELGEDIKVLDYRIPAGSVCFIFPFMLHRDPESFPNPEKFYPERFLPENSLKRHPYAYVPFSAGPRNCIGQKFAIMEEKTIIANILRNFKVESLDHRDKINVIPDLIIRNVEPIRLYFKPRSCVIQSDL